MTAKTIKYKSFNKTKMVKMLDKFSMHYIVGKQATFLHCKFEKGCKVPQHVHPKNEEFLHVVTGKLVAYIGPKKRRVEVQDGETIVIPPKVPHGWIALKDTITYEIFAPARSKKDMDKMARKNLRLQRQQS